LGRELSGRIRPGGGAPKYYPQVLADFTSESRGGSKLAQHPAQASAHQRCILDFPGWFALQDARSTESDQTHFEVPEEGVLYLPSSSNMTLDQVPVHMEYRTNGTVLPDL
jgi:hypothetical protein